MQYIHRIIKQVEDSDLFKICDIFYIPVDEAYFVYNLKCYIITLDETAIPIKTISLEDYSSFLHQFYIDDVCEFKHKTN